MLVQTEKAVPQKERAGNHKRLMPGEVYHLVYYAIVNGHKGACCEGNLTCVKVKDGRYLLQRTNGEQFWIGCGDVECLLDGDPGGMIAAYAENA